MELSFLINALKRYWWVTAMCVIATTLAASTLQGNSVVIYESRALLIVSPPSEAQAALTFSGNSDRYIAGQINVLTSEAMATRVADQVGNGATPSGVRTAFTVVQLIGSDVVELRGTGGTPEAAQKVVDAYITQYFDTLQAQVDDNQGAEVQGLDDRLDALRLQLQDIDTRIADALAPYLPEPGSNADPGSIPTVAQVAPGLDSQKQLLLDEFTQVSADRNQLDINSRLQVTSQIIQNATLPTQPLPESSTLMLVAGVLAGCLLGAFVSFILARTSPQVLDSQQAGQILERPFVGKFPKLRSFARTRSAMLSSSALSGPGARFIDLLCVQAESHARPGNPLIVAVVGTERGAGTTSLAAAMANRYATRASHDAGVLLVDVDANSRELSVLFGGESNIADLLADHQTNTASRRPANAARRLRPFVNAPLVGLKVVGVGGGNGLIRRNTIDSIVRAASAHADIVVFDGGPLLDSAATIQLTQLVDVIVLAVPVHRQRADDLSVVGRQLFSRRHVVLPVETPTSSSFSDALFARIRPTSRRRGDHQSDDTSDDTPSGSNDPATLTRDDVKI